MALKRIESPQIKSDNDRRERSPKCEQYPAFSFRYLTKKKDFNLEHFSKKERRKRENAHDKILKRMSEICTKKYVYWQGLDKKRGCELLNYSQMKFSPKDLDLTSDSKLYIFRTESDEFRIIGYKAGDCPTLHIIGFDFDYSAYNHGS